MSVKLTDKREIQDASFCAADIFLWSRFVKKLPVHHWLRPISGYKDLHTATAITAMLTLIRVIVTVNTVGE